MEHRLHFFLQIFVVVVWKSNSVVLCTGVHLSFQSPELSPTPSLPGKGWHSLLCPGSSLFYCSEAGVPPDLFQVFWQLAKLFQYLQHKTTKTAHWRHPNLHFKKPRSLMQSCVHESWRQHKWFSATPSHCMQYFTTLQLRVKLCSHNNWLSQYYIKKA